MKTQIHTFRRPLLPLIMFLLIGAFLSSCTLQKRRYTTGYHVTWNVSLQSKKKRRPNQPAVIQKIETRLATDILDISTPSTTESILKMNTDSSKFKFSKKVKPTLKAITQDKEGFSSEMKKSIAPNKAFSPAPTPYINQEKGSNDGGILVLKILLIIVVAVVAIILPAIGVPLFAGTSLIFSTGAATLGLAAYLLFGM